jgi:hypothetical protein
MNTMVNLKALLHCLEAYVWLDKNTSHHMTPDGAKEWSDVVIGKASYTYE